MTFSSLKKFAVRKIFFIEDFSNLKLCRVPLSRLKWARVSGSSADLLRQGKLTPMIEKIEGRINV